MREIYWGFIAGFVATAVMSMVMLVLHFFPRKEKQPLPPHQITMTIAEERLSLTSFAHFAYGILLGVVYGLVVWATNYLGIVPLFHLAPSAAKSPPRRNFLMITAHVIWGGFLGWLVRTGI